MLEMIFGIDTSKWNMERKYRVRRAVVFTALAVALGLVTYLVATNLYWTATGYCWGDYLQCIET